MGFFDKLLFWKKEEEIPDLGLPEFGPGPPPRPPASLGPPDFGGPPDMGMPDIPSPARSQYPEPSFPREPSFAPSFARPEPQGDQFALISSKLDTIKAQLDSVLQRLDRLEYKEGREYQQRWR